MIEPGRANVARSGVAIYTVGGIKEIPKISRTKLEGLKEFYGIDSKDATEYFEEHMTADIRHAASWEKIINNTSIDDSVMLSTADKSVSAQNLLLDSCYESYC